MSDIFSREISKTWYNFISHDGEIGCKITGTRLRSLLLEGGPEVPVVTQVSTTVKWRLSNFVVRTEMDFLPFLSMVLEGTMSKYAGVSSMLAVNSYGKCALVRINVTFW